MSLPFVAICGCTLTRDLYNVSNRSLNKQSDNNDGRKYARYLTTASKQFG